MRGSDEQKKIRTKKIQRDEEIEDKRQRDKEIEEKNRRREERRRDEGKKIRQREGRRWRTK